jgi:hypothetical protein
MESLTEAERELLLAVPGHPILHVKWSEIPDEARVLVAARSLVRQGLLQVGFVCDEFEANDFDPHDDEPLTGETYEGFTPLGGIQAYFALRKERDRRGPIAVCLTLKGADLRSDLICHGTEKGAFRNEPAIPEFAGGKLVFLSKSVTFRGQAFQQPWLLEKFQEHGWKNTIPNPCKVGRGRDGRDIPAVEVLRHTVADLNKTMKKAQMPLHFRCDGHNNTASWHRA